MPNTTPTRYQRIVDILDGAAAADADRFWFPREKLLTTRVHGIAMIAPEEKTKPACACCAPVSSGDAAPFPGRGAKSGLVRGLRGEAPFDGTQFPRLPWGGTPVAGDDIDFIANWIDDGLPEADRETSLPAKTQKTEVKLESIEAKNVETIAQTFAVYDGSPNDYGFQYGELKQRMNVDCLSPGQLEQFRLAFRELYRLNKWPEDRRSYNNTALIHQNHCQHGWERFLPWHRVYLYELEQIMQDLVPGVTIPYWDWTMPQYIPEKPEDGWIIPESYKAFITNASLDFLTNAKPALPKKAADILAEQIVGRLYTSQTTFFAAVAKALGDPNTPLIKGRHRERFIDALLAANSLWYPLRYPAEYGKDSTINTVFHYHYPTADDICQIMSLRTFRDFGGGSLYNDSFGYLDQNPHNTLHIWTGGVNPFPGDDDEFDAPAATSHRNRSVKVAGRLFHSREDMYSRPEYGDMLSNLTASFDPVFWPIHVNIDRLWSEWQAMNPHSLPADLGAVLTPWSYTIADTLDMTQFGYEYVKCSFLIPVGLSTPVARFVSKPIDIPEPARKSFKQAEVRLHRVPQLPRSCFIRVFLNLPDADASTPIDHENYAGYLAIFGHGECIGGPGHCELPPSRPRQHDIRPRNHNTPRNHRINVTKSARYLFEKKKAKSLQITLVVIGADYREDTELLRLDGVSLDLLD